MKDLANAGDRLRQYMWHELYVKPWGLKRLCDVDYQFVEEDMKEATR